MKTILPMLAVCLLANPAPIHAQMSEGISVAGAAEGPGKPLALWYRRPAARWTAALLVGNGRLGGMVWGGPKSERIDLNEDTLWSGEPYDNLNPKGLKALPEIRRLLREGKDREAQRLVESDMNGKYNQSYQPLGDLSIEFPLAGEVTNYRRELDLAEAVARVQFDQQGVRYTREVFASHPAQAIVVRLASDKPGKLTFSASLGCQLHHATKAGKGFLQLTGRCPAHVDPSYSGPGVVWDDAPGGKGMRFETRLVPVSEGGRVTITDSAIHAEGCDRVTLLLVAATSYNGPWKSPSREGKDPGRQCDEYLAALAGKSYPALRAEHVADHQRLFNRVTLDLGHSDAEKLPTDAALESIPARQGPCAGGAVLSIRPIPAHRLVAAGDSAGKLARHLEPRNSSALVGQLDLELQRRDQLLAGRDGKPWRVSPAAGGSHANNSAWTARTSRRIFTACAAGSRITIPISGARQARSAAARSGASSRSAARGSASISGSTTPFPATKTTCGASGRR